MSSAQPPPSNRGRGVSFMDVEPSSTTQATAAAVLPTRMLANLMSYLQHLHNLTVLRSECDTTALNAQSDRAAARTFATYLFPGVSIQDETLVVLRDAIVNTPPLLVKRYMAFLSPQIISKFLEQMPENDNGDYSRLRERMTLLHEEEGMSVPLDTLRWLVLVLRYSYNANRPRPERPSPQYSVSFDGFVNHLDSQGDGPVTRDPIASGRQALPTQVLRAGQREPPSLGSSSQVSVSNSPLVISSAGSRASPSTTRSPAQSGYHTPHRPLPQTLQLENEATPSPRNRSNRRYGDLEAQHGGPLDGGSSSDSPATVRGLTAHVRTIREWTFWRRELLANGIDLDSSSPHHCIYEHTLVSSNPQRVLHYCRQCIESQSSSVITPGLLNEYGLVSSRTIYRDEMRELLGLEPPSSLATDADLEDGAVEPRAPPPLPAPLTIETLAKALAGIMVSFFLGTVGI